MQKKHEKKKKNVYLEDSRHEKMYFVTGLAVLAVSAAMFTGCGSKTNAGAPATKAPAATASAAQSKPAKSTASNTASNTGAKISVDDAKKAALTNAGVQEGNVVYKKANLETEDGVLIFEIKFYAGDMEYNYDIDAATGDVLKAESETMDAEDIAERDALLGQASGTTSGAAAEGITEDQAEIALNHAGVAHSDISSSTVKQDFDDDTGVTKYEVEFHVGAQEYKYEIDITTGNILESSVEIDD